MRIAQRVSALLLAGALPSLVLAQAAELPQGVVVTRGEASIGFTDIDARVARIPADKRAGFMNDPQRIDKTVSAMLLARQVAQEARNLGIDQDPVVMADIALYADEVLARRLMMIKMNEIELPNFDTLAHERYLTQPEKYTSAEVLTVRHLIILRDIHGDEAAMKLAEQRREEFLQSGMDFESFVVEFSEEKSRATAKGLVDGLMRGQGAGEFEAAAFALKNPGDISPVVRSRFGYHIIQLLKRQPAKLLPFDKAKEQIVAELRANFLEQQRQKILESFEIQELKASPDRVQSLRTRYMQDGEGAQAISRFDPAPTDASAANSAAAESL